MKTTQKLLALIILMAFALPGWAQSKVEAKRESIGRSFVDAYNRQEYRKMKKHLPLLGKIVLRKKLMKEAFSEIEETYGKFTILKVKHTGNNKMELKFRPEKNPTETESIIFGFDKKNRLTSFYLKNPSFIYPLKKDSGQLMISSQRKALLVDSLVDAKARHGNFNGCVMVIDKGQPLYKKCYGYANFESKALLNDSSVFELASCSKQFTAFAILMLMEQGKLQLSDTLQKYLPDLPYKNITIENLLTHTSGLPDYMSLFSKHWDKKKVANNYDMLALLQKYHPKPYFKPNEYFSYSNTGYALLSIIIEKTSGTSYPNFLQQNIFQPLGMKHSRVYNTRRSQHEFLDNYAFGYVYSASLKKYALPDSLPDQQYVYWLDGITGDGSVNTNINDLVLWETALRENKLLKPATLQKAYSSYKLPNGKPAKYGYGLFVVNNEQSEKVVHHSGGWPGYHTFMLRFTESGKSIAILSNNEYLGFNQMADRIARILLQLEEED